MADPDSDPQLDGGGGNADRDDDAPPRPRKRRIRYFPPQQVIPILAASIGLFAVITMKDSCAQGVENMFRALEGPPDAGLAPGGQPGGRPEIVPRPGGGASGASGPPLPVAPPIVPSGAPVADAGVE